MTVILDSTDCLRSQPMGQKVLFDHSVLEFTVPSVGFITPPLSR